MDEAEAVLSYGISGWPVWVHHAHREQHWRVLEIIEPENAAPSPASINKYILLVDGPFAYLKGSNGEQYITASRRDGRWWIAPNTSVNPRRGIPPGELRSKRARALAVRVVIITVVVLWYLVVVWPYRGIRLLADRRDQDRPAAPQARRR